MTHTSSVPVVASDAHFGHDYPIEVWHGEAVPAYERPERAEIIRATLAGDAMFVFVAPTAHGTGPVEAVHDPAMVAYLAGAWRDWQATVGSPWMIPDTMLHPALRDGMGEAPEPPSPAGRLGYWCFETMTPIVEGTYAAACASADIAITAADIVLAGAPLAYALCRPPGHHAARGVFGGYCFFNNAAVVAQHVAEHTGARVAVLDVDYHHGNGTQQIFYRRADVLYASLHGDPARAYPYFAGHRDETGAGAGLGANCNLPLPEGCDDAMFLAALGQAIDRVDAFGAEVVVVSLGVDTFAGDPLGDFAVTPEALGASGALVAAAGRPLVVLQEGGYAVAEIGDNVRRWLLGASASAGADGAA